MIDSIVIKLIEDAYRNVSLQNLCIPKLARWVSLLTKRNQELMLEYGNHFELQFSNFNKETAQLLNLAGIDSAEYREQVFKNYRYCPFSSFLYSSPQVSLQELEATVGLMNEGLITPLQNHEGEIPYLKINSAGKFIIEIEQNFYRRSLLANCPVMLMIPKNSMISEATAMLHFELNTPQYNRYRGILAKASKGSLGNIENEVYYNLALLDSAILTLNVTLTNLSPNKTNQLKRLIDCWQPKDYMIGTSDAERLALAEESVLNFNIGWFLPQLNELSNSRRLQVINNLCQNQWPGSLETLKQIGLDAH